MTRHGHLLDTHPNLKEFAPFLDDLNRESERGAVLISVSYLEGQLKEIVSTFLCEGDASERLLEGFNAPLGTLAARAAAAAALGLITSSSSSVNVITRSRKPRTRTNQPISTLPSQTSNWTSTTISTVAAARKSTPSSTSPGRS